MQWDQSLEKKYPVIVKSVSDLINHKRIMNDVLRPLTESARDESRFIYGHQGKQSHLLITKYINRLMETCDVDASTLIIAFYYIERAESLSETFYICSGNVHAIVGISLLLANKYNSDDVFSNEYMAAKMGFSMSFVNRIECVFAKLLQYDFNIEIQQFETLKARLFRECCSHIRESKRMRS
jgi:hypothetical protein